MTTTLTVRMPAVVVVVAQRNLHEDEREGLIAGEQLV